MPRTALLAGSFQRVKVRCKTVADDHLSASGKMVEMDLPHDIRMAQHSTAIPGVVELRHTAPLDFGSGGAVDQDAFTSRNPLHYFVISDMKASVQNIENIFALYSIQFGNGRLHPPSG